MARVGARRVRRHRLFWPGVVGVGYLAVVVAVTAAEYVSELQKLSRGSYTDTFSPFLFSECLTFPSNRLFDVWPGYDYSTGFDAESWRDDLQIGLPPLAGGACRSQTTSPAASVRPSASSPCGLASR